MSDGDLDTLLAKLAATPRRRPPLHLVGTKRFELLQQLGSGGFGDVYEARDREYGTRVALKSLKSSHPDWIYRFKREFRIVGDLAHPNLVRLYELFLEDERWYLTMELVDGLRFDEHVRRAPHQLRSCFGQLALGIVELHRASCLHRDLKPSNALVEPTGRVVLLDFGLAVHSRASRTSAVAGTPPYMAPELGLGQPPSAASDWYAFGVMLYDALAERLPFTGNDVECLAAKLGPPPPLPSTLHRDVDPELEALAMRLLSKDPQARPGADELVRALVGGDRVLVDLAPRDRRAPFAGRHRELAALAEALEASKREPVVVTVRGQPGLGKTSLVTTFLDGIRGRAQVYQGRCLELESVPFKGVDGAIDMLCNDLRHRHFAETAGMVPDDVAALAQMFPMVKRVEAFARHTRGEPRARSPHEQRQAAFAALRGLLAKLAERAPVVLFDDDLQWSSDDSVKLLLDLLRAPLLLVVAFRDEEQGAAPAVVQFAAGVAHLGVRMIDIAVEPLDRAAVDELISTLPDAPLTADEAIRETGGHPYLITRLLERGRRFDGAVDLARVLADELDQLDVNARALLELVSVAGGPIPQRAAFAAAGLPRDPATIDQLRRRRLIHASTASTDHLEAYHDRVRDIAIAKIPEERRRALHLAIAGALETVDVAEAETLARHYRAGHDRERALVWTQRAAATATAALAFGRAVELSRDAVSLARDERHRLVLLGALAEAQVHSGRLDDAGITYLSAAEHAELGGLAAEHAAFRARAGEQFLLAGQIEQGLVLLRNALAAVGVTMPISPAVAVAESFNVGGVLATRGLAFRRRTDASPTLLQRVDLELAVARALLLTDLRAPLIATRAVLDAFEAGEPTRVQRALALFVIANSARSPEDPVVIEAEAEAGKLADELGDDLGFAWAQLACGMRAIQCNDFAYALDTLGQAERAFLARSLSYAREATLARVGILTVCGNYAVDLAYARRHQGRVIDEALVRGDLFGATWAQLTRCFVLIAGDDPQAARAVLTQARATWPRAVDSLFTAMCFIYELSADVYEDPAGSLAAVARVEPEFRQLFTSLIPFPRAVFCRLAATSALCAWQAGRLPTADATARIDALTDELAATTSRTAFVALLRSYQRALAGDRSGRIALLERCADDWEQSRQHTLALTARYRIATLRGDRVEALAAELVAASVVDPERFSTLHVGPGIT